MKDYICGPDDYSWRVGHRLKKSVKDLPYKEARAYYRSLKKCKTRFIHQNIPLSILVTHTARKRSQQLKDAVLEENPLTRVLRQQMSITRISGGRTFK